ncbi:MAG: FtsQ-type POTRA domain-containing protein [Candidatus Eremiobacteraeota bacterium]|nr:FtsQ-type POTRA domain-containing protein [Candidatus Eremiobacteraeota bacterium]
MKKSKNGRRTKKSTASRLRPFWIPILLLLVAAAAGSYYGTSWKGFEVKRISVQGDHVVPRGEIVASAAIERHTNLWLQNTRTAAARVRLIPYIDDAWIRRGLPATVTIVVTERTPYAVVQSGAQPAKLIDAHLRVLEMNASRRDLPHLACAVLPQPHTGDFLKDDCVRALARDYETLVKQHVEARSLVRDRLGDVTAQIPPGITIKLGDDSDLEAKGALVDPILSQTRSEGRRIRALDLRAPKTPVVVFQ